jgi:hypothetical protein
MSDPSVPALAARDVMSALRAATSPRDEVGSDGTSGASQASGSGGARRGRSVDLLIVERHANWSQWNRVTKTLRQRVRVLVQQTGENIDELYARAQSKFARPGAP